MTVTANLPPLQGGAQRGGYRVPESGYCRRRGRLVTGSGEFANHGAHGNRASKQREGMQTSLGSKAHAQVAVQASICARHLLCGIGDCCPQVIKHTRAHTHTHTCTHTTPWCLPCRNQPAQACLRVRTYARTKTQTHSNKHTHALASETPSVRHRETQTPMPQTRIPTKRTMEEKSGEKQMGKTGTAHVKAEQGAAAMVASMWSWRNCGRASSCT